MTLQRIQILNPAGEPSLVSPAAAERLAAEGWTVVTSDAPAAAEEVEADTAAAETAEPEKKAPAKKPAAKKGASEKASSEDDS